MLEINCAECVDCCSSKLPLTPVIWPGEESSFKDNLKKVNTPYGPGYLLRRKENGNCIFLDENRGGCAIYNVRPAECRIYPYVLDFSRPEEGIIKLDTRFCPNLPTLKLDLKLMDEFISKFRFPEQFMRVYEALQNC